LPQRFHFGVFNPLAAVLPQRHSGEGAREKIAASTAAKTALDLRSSNTRTVLRFIMDVRGKPAAVRLNSRVLSMPSSRKGAVALYSGSFIIPALSIW
jgi:hypothetical protein